MAWGTVGATPARVPFASGGSRQPQHRARIRDGRGTGAVRSASCRTGARIAVDAPGAGPMAKSRDRGDGDRRRALRRVLRSRRRAGGRTAVRGPVHVRDRGGQPPPRRMRGGRGRGAADRAHRRSPARAPRDRRRPDHRPAEALRLGGALVLRARHPRGRRRRTAPLPLGRMSRLRGRPRRAATGAGPPERALPGSAGPRAAPGRRHRQLVTRARRAGRATVDRRRRRSGERRRRRCWTRSPSAWPALPAA